MNALTSLVALDANDHDSGRQQRADIRSNMFVMAVLYCDGCSAPVRIRNLSRSGALIESAVIPPDGAHPTWPRQRAPAATSSTARQSRRYQVRRFD
jgi:hypothetical protein